MDDASFEHEVPGDELEAVRRALAELGRQPLPPAVATRLEARLAAELSSSPLSARRSRRRRLRLVASLSSAAALVAAAAIVFALSSGGGGGPPGAGTQADALRTSVAGPTVDSAAKTAAASAEAAPLQARKCGPASRTGDARRPAACPGARGGHARAV